MFRINLLFFIMIASIAATATGQVCDLTELDTVATPGMPGQPLLFGGDAFVAAGSAGILRIDLADIHNLSVVESVATSGEARDLALEYFDDLLVVANGSSGVATYRVAANGHPVAVGTAVLDDAIGRITAAPGLFLAGGDAGTLYTIRIADDLAPYEVGSVVLGGSVLGMVERSGVVFVALGSGGLGRVDIHDSAHPSLLDTYDLGGAVTAIARRDNILFVGLEGTGIAVLEIGSGTPTAVTSLALAAAPTRLLAWNDRVYAVGTELGLVEADISLANELLQVGELPLTGANGVALSGEELFIGRGASGFSVVDVGGCANPGGTLTTRVIPAGARAPGTANSFWLTDVAVANLSPGVATISLAYLAKGEDNSNPLRRSMVLGSGQQALLGDLFASAFDQTEANGAIMLTTSHPDVKITSRTYNAAGAEGTYGQFIPALDATAAVTPIASGALLQLQENTAFRTNLGVVNLTAAELEFRIRLFDAVGTELGVIHQTLLPYGMNQYNAAYRIVGATTVDSGFAVVSVDTSDGQLLAYASVVDRGSNDPIWIPTQKLSDDSPYN